MRSAPAPPRGNSSTARRRRAPEAERMTGTLRLRVSASRPVPSLARILRHQQPARGQHAERAEELLLRDPPLPERAKKNQHGDAGEAALRVRERGENQFFD